MNVNYPKNVKDFQEFVDKNKDDPSISEWLWERRKTLWQEGLPAPCRGWHGHYVWPNGMFTNPHIPFPSKKDERRGAICPPPSKKDE